MKPLSKDRINSPRLTDLIAGRTESRHSSPPCPPSPAPPVPRSLFSAYRRGTRRRRAPALFLPLYHSDILRKAPAAGDIYDRPISFLTLTDFSLRSSARWVSFSIPSESWRNGDLCSHRCYYWRRREPMSRPQNRTFRCPTTGILNSRLWNVESSPYPYLPSDIPPYTSADDGTWSSKPLTLESKAQVASNLHQMLFHEVYH